jgi:hypothetical protein
VLAAVLALWATSLALDALRAGDRVADPGVWDVVPGLLLAAGIAAWAVWAFNRARG